MVNSSPGRRPGAGAVAPATREPGPSAGPGRSLTGPAPPSRAASRPRRRRACRRRPTPDPARTTAAPRARPGAAAKSGTAATDLGLRGHRGRVHHLIEVGRADQRLRERRRSQRRRRLVRPRAPQGQRRRPRQVHRTEEGLAHLPGGGKTGGRLHGAGAGDDLVDAGGQARQPVACPGDGLRHHDAQDGQRVRPVEGLLSGQALIEDRAQGEDVGAAIDHMGRPGGLLRGQVGGRAEDLVPGQLAVARSASSASWILLTPKSRILTWGGPEGDFRDGTTSSSKVPIVSRFGSKPRSAGRASPDERRKMLSGLRSRCTTPASWTTCSASQSW